jgi:hypothetical protein
LPRTINKRGCMGCNAFSISAVDEKILTQSNDLVVFLTYLITTLQR